MPNLRDNFLGVAAELIRIAVDRADTVDGVMDPDGYDRAIEWLAAYDELTTWPYRAAVIDIVERGADLAALDGPRAHGVIVPNQVRIAGIPLLISEDGPVIEKIDVSGPGASLVAVTMTVIARRVTIDAEPATDADA